MTRRGAEGGVMQLQIALMAENSANQIAVYPNHLTSALKAARRMAGARPDTVFRATDNGEWAIDGHNGTVTISVVEAAA